MHLGGLQQFIGDGMTNVAYMEITTSNTSSGSYEEPGGSNRPDAFLIGDVIETGKFPTNTLEDAVTVTEA